jgi:hypothetical protein
MAARDELVAAITGRYAQGDRAERGRGITPRPAKRNRTRKALREGSKRSADCIANRDPLAGNRWFESCSLQRGVCCEL